MKKLKIKNKEFIRMEGLYYNLTDLFRLTTLAGISLEAWDWAKQENRTRDISRRGWFFRKSWGKAPVLIEYAKYLTPGLYIDVLKALDMDDPDKLIIMFGELKAAKLDYRVAELITERNARAERARKQTEGTLEVMRKVKLQDTPRFNANDLPRTRSMQMHRDGRTSIQNDIDPLAQILVYDAVTNHSSMSSGSCRASSSHDSWSGDSGSSDSGGGGCD